MSAERRKYAYFPGCSLHASAKEYDMSLKAIAPRLGIELIEIPGWTCCTATPGYTVDPFTGHVLVARNLAVVEEMGDMDVMTPCSGCYKNFAKTSKALRQDPQLLAEVNSVLGERKITHPARVRHPIDVIVTDVGLENVPVDLPLKGLKVASYYGCVISRPRGIFDDPENPTSMDRLVERLGAKAAPWTGKVKCCGGAVFFPRPQIALNLTAKQMHRAKDAEADCVIVGCPFCHLLLDMYQGDVEKQEGEPFNIPILYLTQLIGLAMKIDEKKLGLDLVQVSPAPVLDKVRALEVAA
jgi:heterodisulfide reductase subunit B